MELQLQISPSSEYSGLISFRIDRFDLLAVQRTLKIWAIKFSGSIISSSRDSESCVPLLRYMPIHNETRGRGQGTTFKSLT